MVNGFKHIRPLAEHRLAGQRAKKKRKLRSSSIKLLTCGAYYKLGKLLTNGMPTFGRLILVRLNAFPNRWLCCFAKPRANVGADHILSKEQSYVSDILQ